jgi:hypothetical protein
MSVERLSRHAEVFTFVVHQRARAPCSDYGFNPVEVVHFLNAEFSLEDFFGKPDVCLQVFGGRSG